MDIMCKIKRSLPLSYTDVIKDLLIESEVLLVSDYC
jgi:hypothetical protein